MSDDPKAAPTPRLKKSWLSRTAAASALGLSVGAKVLRKGARRAARAADSAAADAELDDAAHQIAATLGQLRGATMKVGQMMSYVDFGLPDSARRVLASLQDDAAKADPDDIAEVIRQELGQAPELVFAEWDRAPIAAGSIGQVHRATTHAGHEVAVKVQYPGVAEALESDLRNVAVLGRLGGVMSRALDGKGIVDELRDNLRAECDYTREATNQQEFARLFADDPQVRVPAVHAALSTGRVLTSDLEPARRYRAFVDSSDQAARDAAGATISRMAFTSIFRHHLFNCDPHPGNYLFADAPGEVVFLDFGCVRRFDADFVARWKALVRAVLEDDRPAFEDAVLAVGLAPGRKGFDFGYQLRISQYLYRPWLTEGLFRFTPEYVAESNDLLLKDNPNRMKMSLPPEWVFVNRLQWGLYSVLADLRAEADFRSVILDLVYDGTPARGDA